MSATGMGQVEFDDGLDDSAGSRPRKGVIDFGNDDSPEVRMTTNDNRHQSKLDARSAGKR